MLSTGDFEIHDRVENIATTFLPGLEPVVLLEFSNPLSSESQFEFSEFQLIVFDVFDPLSQKFQTDKT